jgi:predicted enzyme related to lactoylglutathione lyase
MRITLASVFVDDQEKALKFYTEVLGFVKKTDLPAGEFRWLTVVSPEGPEGIELVLEPNVNPAARTYQKAIFDAGIPATMFITDDIQDDHDRLAKSGVRFTVEPTKSEWGIDAVFDDTCGNLIGLHQD